MPILSRHEIIEHLQRGELIINPSINENGEFEVEPASYDLRAGIIIWKEINETSGKSNPETRTFEPNALSTKQEKVTLQPGQVMFVITHEEIKMPNHLCGTVYAKNKFSRDGILTLTTGHIDPGVQCPIVIRLINLRSLPYTFHLGEPIYTIVFHKLGNANVNQLVSHPPISMKTTYDRTIESANLALGNALYDLSLTNSFVKKEEIGTVLWAWMKSNLLKTLLFIVGILVTLSSIVSGVPTLLEYIKKLAN
jgi:deoxycytidine triphosphate deaminase